MPTASAVVGDIIEVARNMAFTISTRIGCTCYQEKEILPISELYAQYYIRMTVTDRPGVLAGIAGVFGQHDVSIASVIQKTQTDVDAELILITHLVKEQFLQDSLNILRSMPIVGEINNVIRLEGVGRDRD
jgi:homoserine dehydrogenase